MDMLEYSFSKLKSRLTIPEMNMTIECFLLHYRNLIEFFGGAKRYKDDLSIVAPEAWSDRELTPKEIETFASTKAMLADYWKDISQFLQHCTERRFEEFKEWDPQEMWDRIEPTVKIFREGFPRTANCDVMIVGASIGSPSTATFTLIASPLSSKE
jgi:hypothetical protein